MAGLQGLQNHSIGPMYPFAIVALGNGAAVQWRVENLCTGAAGHLRRTQQEAVMDYHGVKLRNMMHG